MERCFNVTGACNPHYHYMVDIQKCLEEIKVLVDEGKYFTINRARQYGKTTTLKALEKYLAKDYVVISLDFQKIGNTKFSTEHRFSVAFTKYLLRTVNNRSETAAELDSSVLNELERASKEEDLFALDDLFPYLSELCGTAEKPVVLMIDEVDSATNNQVFLDFLAQLRGYYLTRDEIPAFQSVILAGVYDVRNIKLRVRPDEEHKLNSPWNIAADFEVVMSFSESGIAGMLESYEVEHHTGMDVGKISKLIYDYTNGYPFLVSRLCKLLDEKVAGSADFPDEAAAWTREGVLDAVRVLVSEKSTLFDSLTGKLQEYEGLKRMVYTILFGGEKIIYNPDEHWLDVAMMLGFIKNADGEVMIANRIFEMRLYNYFLTAAEAQNNSG